MTKKELAKKFIPLLINHHATLVHLKFDLDDLQDDPQQRELRKHTEISLGNISRAIVVLQGLTASRKI